MRFMETAGNTPSNDSVYEAPRIESVRPIEAALHLGPKWGDRHPPHGGGYS